MTENAGEKISLEIPKDLYDLMTKKMKETSFSNVNDYATYLLHLSVGKEVETFTEEDTKKVTDRLRALGYI